MTPDPATLAQAAAGRLAVMRPGEILVVRVPPEWPTWQIKDLQEALTAVATDPDAGLGVKVLVVPCGGVTVFPPPGR